MSHGLGGIKFKTDVKATFEKPGWSVRTTSTTGDFGAELCISWQRNGRCAMQGLQQAGQRESYSSGHFVRIYYGEAGIDAQSIADPNDEIFVKGLISGGGESIVSFNRREYLDTDPPSCPGTH